LFLKMKNSLIEENIRHIKMKPFQSGFMRSQASFPAFVAGWGTGKTMFGIFKAVKNCEDYPNNQWLVVRKEYMRLEDSTIPDFEKYTKLKVGSDKNVHFDNGSILMFRHGEQIASSEVLQNMNLGGFVMEQAEEFDTDKEFQMLRGRNRREDVPHFGCIIANTKGHNWIYRFWKIKDLPLPTEEDIRELMRESGWNREEVLESFGPNQYELFEATTFDNQSNLPVDYIQDKIRMKTEAPHLFNRFVLNSWEDLDISDKVIPYSDIREAINHKYIPMRDKTIIACDPCEFGDDEGVIYGIKNGEIIKHKFFKEKDGSQIAAYCQIMRREIKAQAVVLDPIGIGADTRTWLSKMGEKLLLADSREASTKNSEGIQFFNRRAEMWWEAKRAFAEREAGIPDDPILIEELSQVGFELTPRGYKVEAKEILKKADRIGHSPNRADCLIYGLWGLSHIEYDSEAIYPDDMGHGPQQEDDRAACSYSMHTSL